MRLFACATVRQTHFTGKISRNLNCSFGIGYSIDPVSKIANKLMLINETVDTNGFIKYVN